MKTKDIDKPVDKCPKCQADIWESMISGRLLLSCNCNEARKYVREHNKKIEDGWGIKKI